MKMRLLFEGPILPGSISMAMGQCGKIKCRCKDRNPKLHGPYYRWTGIIDGKRTTITIDKETMKECKKRINRYTKLKAKIESVLSEALANAPWIK